MNEEKNRALLAPGTGRDVTLVQGARQVGKTTLVQRAVPHWPDPLMLNFECDLDAL